MSSTVNQSSVEDLISSLTDHTTFKEPTLVSGFIHENLETYCTMYTCILCLQLEYLYMVINCHFWPSLSCSWVAIMQDSKLNQCMPHCSVFRFFLLKAPSVHVLLLCVQSLVKCTLLSVADLNCYRLITGWLIHCRLDHCKLVATSLS